MQPSGVIITAIVLALVLAGALWYSLTREEGAELVASPTPTPLEELAPLLPPEEQRPAAEPDLDSTTTLPVATSTQVAVPPTAQSGTGETTLLLAAVALLGGGWHLLKRLRRAV
ncbi:MAG: hypothetical protein WEA04_02390 [Candidatus Andersenbacteria bacterium]